jgi:histidinol phosphatase-like enzyme
MTVDSSPSSYRDSSTSGDCPLRKKQLELIDRYIARNHTCKWDTSDSIVVRRAAKDFQVAMDRCMQVESVYLEKISGLKTVDGLAATDVCIAHVLASTYRQFQHPEEWAYVHRTKVRDLVLRPLIDSIPFIASFLC